MQTIKLEIEDDFYQDIMKSGVNVKRELYKMLEILRANKVNLDTEKKAFGILKNKMIDPVEWQINIRNEEDREIYKDIQK